MWGIEESIESQTEESSISKKAMSPWEKYPLALRIEMQEEIDFQNRVAKETQAIFEIKKIAQAQLEYYLEIKSQMHTVEDCIRLLVDATFFEKQTTEKKHEIKQSFVVNNWKRATMAYEDFFKVILKKINTQSHNLVETLYMEIYGFDLEIRAKHVWQYNKTDDILHALADMKKILSPFLTKEFFYYFDKITRSPGCRYNMHQLSKAQKNRVNRFNSNIAIDMLEEIGEAGATLFSKARKNNVLNHPDIEEALEKIDAESKRVCKIVLDGQMHMVNAINAAQRATSETECINITLLPIWRQVRSNFSMTYNMLRKIEEMSLFLDEWLGKKKTRVPLNASKKQSVETVPALDDAFEFEIEAELSDSESGYEDDAGSESDSDADKRLRAKELEAFREYKAQQLFLWRKVVKYRQEQRAEKEKLQKEQLEKGTVLDSDKDTIDTPRAQQLCDLYQNLDGQDIQLYDSLFKSDASCKPHNVCFKAIEKLVRNIGGELKNDTGSSHFPIYLPDTHYIWSVNTQSQSMSYLAVPCATGGSYKPHNTSDEWTHSAHLLLKNAFIKAGITPERIAQAHTIIQAQKLIKY